MNKEKQTNIWSLCGRNYSEYSGWIFLHKHNHAHRIWEQA